MEKKLKRLFDYQKFEENERLGKMIAEAEAPAALSDEDLGFVNAAQAPMVPHGKFKTTHSNKND
ncbi:MAG: hypothetical protein KBS81_01795 [Spirochaetales bacterium]|nr:hypothetical protein [Candidatus Physcosoma equi]